MADPAKLQLLTRHPGGEGFQLHAVESSHAYLQFRPMRAPDAEWEITPQPRSPGGWRNYILKSLSHDRYLLLNEREYFLWQQMDGRRSLNDISRTLHLEYGSFDYALIRQFLVKLYHAGLVAEPPATGLHRSLAGQRDRWWKTIVTTVSQAPARVSFELPDADRYCSLIYKRGGFLLFNRFVLTAALLLTVAAIFSVTRIVRQGAPIATEVTARPFLTTAIILIALIIVSMLHVLVHALTCKAYGRKVRSIGFFLLQGIWPTFYADVTDIFMSSRRARVVVDFAGPMVEVVFGSLAFLAAYALPPGIPQALLFGAGVLLWEGAVLNLYPFNFLEMDGYNILADSIGMPALRQQAFELFRSLPQRLRERAALQRSEWIQLGYLVLCAISVVVYLVVHLDAIGIDMSRVRSWFLGTN